MVLVIVLGDIGSGKTLLLTLLACGSEREVFANFKIEIPNANRIKTLGIDDIPNNVDIFLDELPMIADSRTASSIANRYVSYESAQQRKDFADIYGSSQFFHMVDKRLQDLCHVLVKCSRIGSRDKPEGFYYEFMDLETFERDYVYLPIENAQKYFDIYDTYEKITPSRKRYYRLRRMKDEDSPKFMEECERIAKELNPLMKKITKDNTTNTLLENDYPSFIMSQVYHYLKKYEK